MRGNPRGVPKISDEAIRKMIKRYPVSRRREAIFTLGISGGIPISRIRRALEVKKNPARQPDEAIARELYLFIENDEILLTRRYPQYILNLERKMKRGVYDREKAVKLFMYLADEASKRYSKQFGDGKTHTADVPTRMLLAKMLRDRFESERRAMGIPEAAMPEEMTDLEEPRGIIRGKRVIRKNPAARTKTWKLGEYGGNIKANVNQSGTAVQIIVSNNPIKQGAYGRLFRWPLDRNGVDEYLNNFTTSYYSSKIIEWIDSVTKGTSMNPVPAGYHTMPDGRVMADSEHSVSTNPRGIDPNLEYKKEYGWTFVDFLKKRLIPDLRESGMYATIADYQRGISLYNDKKGVLPSTQYLNYLKYLRETLIPDLKESGSDSTAADFERMYKMVLYTWNNHPKIRKTKYRQNPPPLFKSGGFIVVRTYKDGRQDFSDHIETMAKANALKKYRLKQDEDNMKYRGTRLLQSVEVLPHTEILRNPPLSSHGSSIRTKRTHGLSLAQMRALYKLVQRGNDMAIAYARKKLEVPRSESKVQLLAVVDHHIRDLAGR